jgi:biotin carboxyl carrier protein
MKMENTLTAPRDGVVKSITIAKGETVEKGKLLIELEKND